MGEQCVLSSAMQVNSLDLANVWKESFGFQPLNCSCFILLTLYGGLSCNFVLSDPLSPYISLKPKQQLQTKGKRFLVDLHILLFVYNSF